MTGLLSAAGRQDERRRERVVLHPLADQLLVDLAGGAQRDVVDEDDVVGHPPFGDLALQEVEVLLLVLGLAGLELDDQDRALVPFGVGGADDGGQFDLGMADRDVLDLDGARSTRRRT
jgi:hypothetical protein